MKKENKWNFIKIWKVILYLNLFLGLFAFINIIFKPLPILAELVDFIPFQSKFFLFLFVAFPIIILFLFHKKSRLAYDLSLVFIMIKILQQLYNTNFFFEHDRIAYSLLTIFTLLFDLLLGYWIYSDRAKFGVK